MPQQFFDAERVPVDKAYRISTRGNSDYKWITNKHVIGCLEVPSEPQLLLDEEYIQRPVADKESFERCLDVWEKLKLKDSFVKACADAPKVTCCCGYLLRDDETIKEMVPALNKGWVRSINQQLLRENKGFKIDCFVWNWHNATGKSETNILLIRFHEHNPNVVES